MLQKKLLTIHQGALGDVVTSFTPLLLLKKNYHEIDLVSRQSISHMAEYLGVINRGFGLESANFSYLYLEKTENIKNGFDDFLRSYDEIVVFSFSKIMVKNIQKISGKRIFQIPPRPLPRQPIHVGKFLISKLVDTGLLAKDNELIFHCVYHDYRNFDYKKKKIFLHPGSGSQLKNWPFRFFSELEILLAEDGFEPVVILGPAEMEISENLSINYNHSNRQFFHSSDLVELVDMLKTGGGFIGNDSGVSHLSAFMGLPTLVIFGPTDPIRWSPAGQSVGTIRYPCNCDPCFETSTKGCDSVKCLTSVSPKQVQQKFTMMIN